MINELQTDRLILTPLELEDAVQTQSIFPYWQIVEFMNALIPWPYPADGALTYYRDVALPAMAQGKEWHWALRLKQSSKQHIGALGLINHEHANRGFWLGTPWQGQGLMTEAVSAANDYWFDVLGFSVLRSSKALANLASRRISQKTGMRMIATTESDYVSGRWPTEIWEITAAEWRARRAVMAEDYSAPGERR